MITVLLEQGIRCLIRRTAGVRRARLPGRRPARAVRAPEDHARAAELVESHFGLH